VNIRWANIFGLVGLICVIYLFFKIRSLDNTAWEEFRYRFISHDPLWLFLFLALICVTVIAIVKILKQK
jgi:hypothetical protein